MLYQVKGYVIKEARPTGGKAGKGCNKTTSLKICKGNFVLKYVRYKVSEPLSKGRAFGRSLKWIKKQTND
jgi:hypothetical protein